MMPENKKHDEPKAPSTTPSSSTAGANGSWEELGETYFVKKAPFQLPPNAKEALVNFLPWITLVAGVFMALSAWGLYNVYRWADNLTYYAAYAPARLELGMVGWVAIVSLLVTAVIYFMAFPGLRDRKKKGWTLLVYAEVAYVAYGLIWLFGHGGLGSLLGTFVSAVVALYLLFQVRSYYKS